MVCKKKKFHAGFLVICPVWIGKKREREKTGLIPFPTLESATLADHMIKVWPKYWFFGSFGPIFGTSPITKIFDFQISFSRFWFLFQKLDFTGLSLTISKNLSAIWYSPMHNIRIIFWIILRLPVWVILYKTMLSNLYMLKILSLVRYITVWQTGGRHQMPLDFFRF